jgi:hypothetical protein
MQYRGPIIKKRIQNLLDSNKDKIFAEDEILRVLYRTMLDDQLAVL